MKEDSERVRLAKEKGCELARRAAQAELSSDEMIALSNEFAALLEQYPDVYPSPPVSPEVARAHAMDLKEKEEALRRHEEEAAALSREFTASLHQFEAATRERLPPATVEPMPLKVRVPIARK